MQFIIRTKHNLVGCKFPLPNCRPTKNNDLIAKILRFINHEAVLFEEGKEFYYEDIDFITPVCLL
jgi:hypothetical protein